MNVTTYSGKMVRVIIIFAMALSIAGAVNPITPTKGRPWPIPQSEQRGEGRMSINPNLFKFNATNFICPILQKAFERYRNITFLQYFDKPLSLNAIPTYNSSFLFALDVKLLSKCEEMPYLNMDEQYQLKICAPEDPQKAVLISNTIWGALRGLETFSQLVVPLDDSPGLFGIDCTQILDFPTYSHRGLMLDTSRHYLPMDIIKQNLDLMAMSKYNVFHWHIVDSPSFPYVSGVFPKLSKKGAWSDIHVYTQEDISEIIEYARIRGIRVIAEFDTPGHTFSWGKGRPGLLTQCFNSQGKPNGKFGPIDPSKEQNFKFIKKLFKEVSTRFPDHYLHLGGDEVPFDCWMSNPAIANFMKKINITGDYFKLEQYYFTKLLEVIAPLQSINRYIVWEEVFTNRIKVANDSVIHIWKHGNEPPVFHQKLKEVTKAGYYAILSSCWYLNYISYGKDWYNHYLCDPRGFQGTEDELRRVIGGEACMWGEYVDKTNIIPRTWPRACAVAEKLWSPSAKTKNPTAAEPRLEEHRCRLQRRGYPAEPLGPSYCEGIL